MSYFRAIATQCDGNGRDSISTRPARLRKCPGIRCSLPKARRRASTGHVRDTSVSAARLIEIEAPRTQTSSRSRKNTEVSESHGVEMGQLESLALLAWPFWPTATNAATRSRCTTGSGTSCADAAAAGCTSYRKKAERDHPSGTENHLLANESPSLKDASVQSQRLEPLLDSQCRVRSSASASSVASELNPQTPAPARIQIGGEQLASVPGLSLRLRESCGTGQSQEAGANGA